MKLGLVRVPEALALLMLILGGHDARGTSLKLSARLQRPATLPRFDLDARAACSHA